LAGKELSDRDVIRETASVPSSSAPDEETRGGFLGFVAHEMRNPLSTALWSAELLARLPQEERAGARGEKLAGMCLRALQRLRFLVEDHFLAERLDVAGIPLRPEAVPLREALEAARGKLQLAPAVSGDEEVAVLADRNLLERALEGLIAVAASGEAPVRVGIQVADGRAVIDVRGARPPPDALAPPNKGTQSSPTGRALALHMSARVAKALGGSLHISPDGEGYLFGLQLARPKSG
jgi:signal transduction histidine kinase